MADLNSDSSRIDVRLAESDAEIEAAQRLRYQIFYEEYQAQPDEGVAREKLDFDEFDPYAAHLIALDPARTPENQIIGTYRLLDRTAARRAGQFYSSSEYDISKLVNTDMRLLELGRSCVAPAYRTRAVLQYMWQGLANYVFDNRIDALFGCASLHGTDIDTLAPQLSYLYHYHSAPDSLRARALDSRYVNMNIIPKDNLPARDVFNRLPPLIKGYLRAGSLVGDGAVVDYQFNTTDVFVTLPTERIAQKYRQHYERKNGRVLPTRPGAGDVSETVAREHL